MNKIVIDFLAETDYSGNAYKAAKSSIAKIPPHLIFRCKTLDDIQQTLQNFSSESEPLMITFMAHGYPTDIRTVTGGYLLVVPYTALVPVLAACKGKYPLIVNLASTCNSYGIADFLGEAQIDELWLTTTTTMSLDKGLVLRENGSFESFYDNLEGGDIELYQQLKT